MSWFEETIGGLSSVEVFVAGALAALVVAIIAFLVIKLVRKASCKVMGGHYPQKNDARNSQQVYTELVELRALTSADRAFVLRFHNGMEFLPSNPVWKLTCTHEFAKHGVRYSAGDYQSVLASRMIKIVGTLLTGESDDDGVRIARECAACPDSHACESGNSRMIVVQHDEMSSGFEKFMMGEQNVKTALFRGITFEGQVVGVAVLHFCDSKLDSEAGLGTAIKTLCESSVRIQYLLGNKSL